MMKRTILFVLLTVMSVVFLFSCEKKEDIPQEELAKTQVRTVSMPTDFDISSAIVSKNVAVDRSEKDDYDEEETLSSELCYVNLGEDGIVCTDKNGEPLPYAAVSVAGNVVVISRIGTYVVTGALSDGRIIVSSEDRIQLILKGVDLKCANAPALETYGTGKKIVTLSKGTENRLSDGEENIGDGRAVVSAKSTLLINGKGKLAVEGNDNGITASAVKIKDAVLTVNARGRAVDSASYLFVSDAALELTSKESVMSAVKEITVRNSALTLSGGEIKGQDVALEEDRVVFSGEGDGFVAERIFFTRKSTLKLSVKGDGIVAGSEGEEGIARFADCTVVISDGDDGVKADYLSFLSGTLLCYGMGTQLNVKKGVESSADIKEVFLYEIVASGKTVGVGEISTLFDREWRTFSYVGKAADGCLYLDGEKYALLW